MALFRFAICSALLAGAMANSLEVKPIEKVISLIEDMVKEVESDGKNEAATYAKFSCFCKRETGSKSDDAIASEDDIRDFSADIKQETAKKEEDQLELSERKTKQEQLSADLQAEKARYAKEEAKYDAEAADMNKAISSLKGAIKAMASTGGEAALISVRQGVQETLKLAEAMNMIPAPKHKVVSAFLQGAKATPDKEAYDYHSQGIIDVMKDLLKDFTDAKKDLDDEWEKTEKGCKEMIASLEGKMKSNKFAMEQLDKSIERLIKSIAGNRVKLVDEEAALKDTELFLKDLTARCEARANDFDQRSQMRDDELTALNSALKILTEKVKSADAEANERAALLQRRHRAPKKVAAAKKVETPVAKAAEVVKANTTSKTTKTTVKIVESAPAVKKAISFLQGAMSSSLRGGLSDDQRKEKALALIAAGGQQLNSMTLTAFAARAAGDPFKKVKGLIQKLIERLLEESRAEATKKGFCDTELAKAEHDRDARREESLDISAELSGLEAKRDFLIEELKELRKSKKEEELALKLATEDRKDEKDENLSTIKTAKEGYEAVTDALLILKKFYKQAAKAAFVQVAASPLDELKDSNAAEGSYKGSQDSSKAVLGLLETIQSDFDRTIRQTTAEEDKSARDYEEFAQRAKSEISSKATKIDLDDADLKTTKNDIESGFDDLQTAADRLDAALKELEELKPTCIDSGMSYAERVAKREEEMDALKKALCILDTDGVESMC